MLEAAAHFRAKPKANRTAEFKLLWDSHVFPFTPVEQEGPNRFRIDRDRLSCIMTSRDLESLLGRPSDRRRGALVYSLTPPPPRDQAIHPPDTPCDAVFFIESRLVKLIAFEGEKCIFVFEKKE